MTGEVNDPESDPLAFSWIAVVQWNKTVPRSLRIVTR